MKKIPFSKPDIRNEDINKVVKSLKSGWLTHGKYTKQLEGQFEKFTKAKYATTVSNCTSGLHLACIAIGLKKGDEVIVPAQTHAATAHAAELTGAKVVFAEVNQINGNILFSDIKKKINKKTKCVILVHMTGIPCDLSKIIKLCNKKKIRVIEDCAHALGTTFQKKHVGNFGICGVFSFYPTKQITSGEGGVFITNSKKIFEKVKILKALGVNIPPDLRKKQGIYDVTNLGLNYRLTDFQAALALGQINRYHRNLSKRKKNAKTYIKELSRIKKLKVQKFDKNNSYFIFQIFLANKLVRNKILAVFKRKGIGASIHYATPVPLLSYYKKKYKLRASDFRFAKKYSDTVISLPVHPYINKNMIKYISSIIKENI